jgi:hypothetical protein
MLLCHCVFLSVVFVFILSYAVFFKQYNGLLFIPCCFIYYLVFLCIGVVHVEFAFSVSPLNSCATVSIL